MYNWRVKKLLTYPNYYGKTDLEFTVYYTLENAEGVVYYSSAQIVFNQDDNFILKDQLAEENIINKVKSSIGNNFIASLEKSLDEHGVVIELPNDFLLQTPLTLGA